MERVGSFLRAPTHVRLVRGSSRNHRPFAGAYPVIDEIHEIVFLDFSRNPKEFNDVLRDCAELSECREALKKIDVSTQLPSGAHLFVRPGHVEGAMEAILREGWELARRHIVVAKEFEEIVMDVIRRLRSKSQVRLKGRETTSARIVDDSYANQVQQVSQASTHNAEIVREVTRARSGAGLCKQHGQS